MTPKTDLAIQRSGQMCEIVALDALSLWLGEAANTTRLPGGPGTELTTPCAWKWHASDAPDRP